MRIKQLRLQNIRSYVSEVISFSPGSTLLAGDIGAGKSTILLAIEFVLFGMRRKYLTGSTLLRNGAKQGEIELTFELSGKEIIVKRVLKRGAKGVAQSAGYIVVDGVKQNMTAIEIKSKILEMLSYPAEFLTKSNNLIYTYTVYTPQEEMKAILTDDEDTRLDVLRKVFGFNKYKKVRENSVVVLKEMRGRVKRFEGSTADLVEKRRFKLQLQEQLSFVKDVLKKTSAELESLNAKLVERNKKIEFMQEQEKELQKLSRELGELKVHRDGRQSLFLRLGEEIKVKQKEMLELEKDLAQKLDVPLIAQLKLEEDAKQREELIFKVTSEKSAVQNKLQFLEQNIVRVDNDIREMMKDVETLETNKKSLSILQAEIGARGDLVQKKRELELKMLELCKEMRELEVHKEHSGKLINQVNELDNCPLCLQSVGEEHKSQIRLSESGKVEQWESRYAAVKLESEMYGEEFERLDSILKELENKVVEFEKLKVSVTLAEKNVSLLAEKQTLLQQYKEQGEKFRQKLQEVEGVDVIRLKDEVERAKAELQKWQEYKLKLQQREQKEKRLAEFKLLRIKQEEERVCISKELEELGGKLLELDQKVAEFKGVGLQLGALRKEMEEFSKLEKGLLVRRAGYEQEIKEKEGQVALLNEEIVRKEKDKKDMERLKEMANWVNKAFIPLTVTIERHIMMHVYQLFNELFKKWLGMLIEGDVISVSLDTSFTPVITQNGFDIDYAHLSGGEKTSVALAYRLALNRVINDLYRGIGTSDLVILDEPTDGFSNEHLDKLRDVFDNLSMKQLVIVSHESKIESFVDNVVRVVKNEHVSRVFG